MGKPKPKYGGAEKLSPSSVVSSLGELESLLLLEASSSCFASPAEELLMVKGIVFFARAGMGALFPADRDFVRPSVRGGGSSQSMGMVREEVEEDRVAKESCKEG